ncbi:cAMP-dependent protein kinase regulatory subunit Cgs1 [Schizosaccharomyces japonicus yFS275]|uniref:cAMP-dependent protein kinase regulatory subunit n=1 Tax=Schizosaccharomyces japonicus (strain yFS275 / FY16936) TaxID=402676 RepID=B6K056_SCHJY|nr:cAMP-dependent protein kinase regulatory subunit Cgs1 [Schizosaccharomyces japonicus yFS275]EEB06206.1 cAMP-dependent protein kinase regulatory subunit Cgs1 [Schizosaccharomyces japonicus yFS275]
MDQFEGLVDELRFAVQTTQPADLLNFCADFFRRKLAQRDQNGNNSASKDAMEQDEVNIGPLAAAGPDEILPNRVRDISIQQANANNLLPSEKDALKELQVKYPENYNLLRRQSVSTESVNPMYFSQLPSRTKYAKKSDAEIASMKRAINKNFLFKNLDEEHYTEVLNQMTEKHVKEAGTPVIVQSDVGDYFYIVAKGEFNVYKREEPNITPQEVLATGYGPLVATIQPGEYFGELALMYNAPRAASVVSKTPDCVLWALDRITFRRIVLENAYRQRKMYESLLEDVPILSKLSNYERQKIADALQTVVYPEGSIVVRQGDEGENFYLIESGEAEVIKEGQGVIAILTKGEYFGELALIYKTVRNATVRARTRLKLATFDKAAFNRLLGNVIDTMRHQPRAEESEARSNAARIMVQE